MTVVPGPVEFTMGSPVGEAGRTPFEMQRRRRIARNFAISVKAVTVGQWKAFLRAASPVGSTNRASESATENVAGDDFPISGVTWYDAAKYCRWLSEREGVDEKEMCYPEIEDIKDGMEPFPDYLRRTGYRLATEAEWEYSCRAGSMTARYFGDDVGLLERYAWFQGNSGEHMWPVGQKRPNDFGLFDMHGNAYTWVQDAFDNYPANSWRGIQEDNEVVQAIRDSQIRVLRGGSYDYLPSVVRSAFRTGYRPSFQSDIDGLRIARTWR
jgi:formylglycine-generating enzyme required for sulfatase activity